MKRSSSGSSKLAASSFHITDIEKQFKRGEKDEFVKKRGWRESACLSLRYFIWFILKGYSIHINLSHFGHCSFYHLEFLCILLLLGFEFIENADEFKSSFKAGFYYSKNLPLPNKGGYFRFPAIKFQRNVKKK